MRLFFGVWKLALLAALQILISLPLMYWLVTVLFGQAKLSAFAGASLWVARPQVRRVVGRGRGGCSRGHYTALIFPLMALLIKPPITAYIVIWYTMTHASQTKASQSCQPCDRSKCKPSKCIHVLVKVTLD